MRLTKRIKCNLAFYGMVMFATSSAFAQYEKCIKNYYDEDDVYAPAPVGERWICPATRNDEGLCESTKNPQGRCREIRIAFRSPNKCGDSQTKCEECHHIQESIPDQVRSGLCNPAGLHQCICDITEQWHNLGSKSEVTGCKTTNPCK